VIIHELYEKGAHGLYESLKDVITQKTVEINPKGIEPYKIENVANFITISNHGDALPLFDRDRRYLVVRCADDPRYGGGTERSQDYYARLFSCIGTPDAPGDEARRAVQWLQRRDIKLNCQNNAPETEAKTEMVEASRSSLEKFLREAMEAKAWPLPCPIINAPDVVEALPVSIESRDRNIKTVEATLREIGARPLMKLGAIYTASGRKRLWALDGRDLAKFEKMSRVDVAAIYDKGRKSEYRNAADSAADDFDIADAPEIIAPNVTAAPLAPDPWD
jgi:hypothetical protein